MQQTCIHLKCLSCLTWQKKTSNDGCYCLNLSFLAVDSKFFMLASVFSNMALLCQTGTSLKSSLLVLSPGRVCALSSRSPTTLNSGTASNLHKHMNNSANSKDSSSVLILLWLLVIRAYGTDMCKEGLLSHALLL